MRNVYKMTKGLKLRLLVSVIVFYFYSGVSTVLIVRLMPFIDIQTNPVDFLMSALCTLVCNVMFLILQLWIIWFGGQFEVEDQ